MKNETQTFDPVARRLGIGASEAAAALGLSRYRSPLDVYIDKTKEFLSPRNDTPQTKRGKRLERVVLDMYEEEIAPLSARSVPTITSTKYSFMFASLDGVRADDNRPVEAKTAGKYVAREWGDAGTDDVPQEYLIQIMHQMIVTEKEIGDISALITLDDFRNYTIEMDKEFAEMIIEGLKNFWQRVDAREAPEPMTGHEAEKLYRKSMAQGIEATDEIAAAYHQLVEIQAQIKPLEKHEERLIGDIKLFMREKDTLIIEAKSVLTWKTSKRATRLDAKRLAIEMPDIHARFLTQSEETRRFVMKRGKNESAE